MSLDRWRALSAYLPAGAVPTRPDFGTRYPWRDVALHSRSRELAHRVRVALDVLREAASLDASWWVSLSGKDSRAVALLVQEAGLDWPALSVGDDAAMPGEEASVERAAQDAGRTLTWIRPSWSVLGWLRDHGGLTGDLTSRSSPLASWAFFEPLERHRERHEPYGVVWGLRASESRGRRMSRLARGTLYRTASEGWRCAPVSDWSALDVHAYLWLRGHALPPAYLCIDPGMDPLGIRTDWWFSPGWTRNGPIYFGWLRRWWHECWRLAVEIDPEVATVS